MKIIKYNPTDLQRLVDSLCDKRDDLYDELEDYNIKTIESLPIKIILYISGIISISTLSILTLTTISPLLAKIIPIIYSTLIPTIGLNKYLKTVCKLKKQIKETECLIDELCKEESQEENVEKIEEIKSDVQTIKPILTFVEPNKNEAKTLRLINNKKTK